MKKLFPAMYIQWGLGVLWGSVAIAALGEMIPADRRINWQGSVGLNGGIPTVTTIYTNFSAPPSLAELQTAVNNCPSNQVVKLGAWTNTYSSDLQVSKDGAVLRGTTDAQGRPLTKILFSGGRILLRAPNFSSAALDTAVNLILDGNKGDTSILLPLVPSWVRVGELYIIDELDDPALISGGGQQSGQTYREIEGNGPRGKAQLVKVASKTATTVSFELPLNESYRVTQLAQLAESAYDAGSGARSLKRAGIEDISFEYTYADAGMEGIRMENADNCWLKNVQSYNCPGSYHIWNDFDYRCQIRHCELSYSHFYGGGQAYGLALYHYVTSGLYEDNTIHHTHNGVSVNYGCSGNVFAYNYLFDGISDALQEPSITAHGVCTWQCLFEGNYCYNKVLYDFTHGSGASHHTVFRNRILGLSAAGGDQVPISIEEYNRANNVIGNLLGVAGIQNRYAWVAPASCNGSAAAIYRLGYFLNADCATSNYDSSGVLATLIHANYDVVTATNNGIVWDPETADHALPASYYLAGKPAWFGNLAWPPFNPASPSANSPTNIPAGYRYVFGADPPSAAPPLTIIRSGAYVILTWSAGTLQQADTVTGPYTTVTGASSPYSVPATVAKKFYRTQ